MRMKNRFCRLGNTLLGAACLLSTCGVTYSCSDDYDLPDTKPSFLGGSIYDELKSRGTFSTVVRMIDEVEDYKDILSKTGSVTMFVADDNAYARLFASGVLKDGNGNPVTSYEQLSAAQKKMILKGSMISSANVLEMLTTIQGPTKNLCLRQNSALDVIDTIRCWNWQDLPNNLNEGQLDKNGKVINADRRFWDDYRTEAQGKMYIATDQTAPLMTHFLQSQLTEKKITHEDVSFILGLKDTWSNSDNTDRSYIYNSRVVEQDVTCLNGYFNVVDSVIITPPNMAEVIRTNGDTKIFSALLDRFAAPYYSATLTTNYKESHGDLAIDKVYYMAHIAQRNSRGSSYNTWVNANDQSVSLGDYPYLDFDPGWNAYTVNQSTKEQDMAAMFVPCDEAMEKYFGTGAGRTLIERYSPDYQSHDLLYNIQQIPLSIIKPFVSNLMKESFNETVPSKYTTIYNDAQDPMFSGSVYGSVEAYKQAFKRVHLASNGVVYVLNDVVGPAAYSSVMAPALYNDDRQVFNTVLHADESFVNDATANQKAPLRKFYSTYLLAMQSDFSLFIPSDDGLLQKGYADVMTSSLTGSTNLRNRRIWTFEPEAISGDNANKIAIRARAYQYDTEKDFEPKNAVQGAVSIADASTASGWGLTKKDMLCEMVDHHIIVHDYNDLEGVNGSRRYYTSRSGAPIYIKKRPTGENGKGMLVDGGLQLMFNSDENPNNDFDCEVTRGYDERRTEANGMYGNGMTYFIDRPIQATFKTVYNVMKNTQAFNSFYQLCDNIRTASTSLSEKFKNLSKYKDLTTTEWNLQKTKYNLFDSRTTANDEYLVRFFNNYRYTIFVPSDNAMAQAYADGLPTPESIEQYIEANSNESGEASEEVLTKAEAMYLAMLNFVEYHFCDNALYVDNCTATTRSMSACTDDATGGFIRVTVNQQPDQMSVTDVTGRTCSVSSTVNNLLARDYELDAKAANARQVKSSSYVALHSIGDNFMLFTSDVMDGSKIDFTKLWETTAAAKAFAKRYRIKK